MTPHDDLNFVIGMVAILIGGLFFVWLSGKFIEKGSDIKDVMDDVNRRRREERRKFVQTLEEKRSDNGDAPNSGAGS